MAGKLPSKEEISKVLSAYLAKTPGVACEYDKDADTYLLKDANGKEAVIGPGWKCSDDGLFVELAEILMTSREVVGSPIINDPKPAPVITRPAPQKPVYEAPVKPQAKTAGFRPAQRKKAKLRLGISGPSGSGKTASSLLIAYGITGDWGKIGLIDTENGSGELYVGQTINGVQIGEYNVLPVTAPYSPDKYISGIRLAEESGLEVVVLDSLSHAWAGEGGLLDQHGKIADSGRGNSWTAWRTVTPKHNALVEAMLNSKIHIIATMRAKTEHVQEKDEKGRTVIKKVGMSPIQREGMEYEMTTFLDIDINHMANASKDRANLFATDAYFKPGPEVGQKLKTWLEAA